MTKQATLSPTLNQIAWAAGVFEGEGSACWAGTTPQVRVTQKGIWLLERFQELFGGAIYKTHKNCHCWQVNGSRARGFILTIYTYMSPRRKEQLKKCLAPSQSSL